MKNLFLLVPFALCFLLLNAQDSTGIKPENLTIVLPKKNMNIFYEDIVIVDSTFKKDYLFSRAKLWLARKIYESKADVVDVDRESGKLVGTVKYKFDYKYIFKITCEIKPTFEITVKDGKYRIQYYDYKTSDGLTVEGDLTKEYDRYLKWGKKGLPVEHAKFAAFKIVMETLLSDFQKYMKEKDEF